MSLNDFIKNIQQEQVIQERVLVDTFLQEIDRFLCEREGRDESYSIKPSSYYKCMRAIYYSLKQYAYRDTTTAKGRRILDVGTRLHEYVQDDILSQMQNKYCVKLANLDEIPSLKSDGLEFIKEHGSSPMEVKFHDTRFTNTIPISAMVDGILEIDNQICIYEFKTINADAFKSLIAPLDDHIQQGAIYALCLGIDQVLFHYMCKNTQSFKAFVQKYDSATLDLVQKRIQKIEYHLETSILPEPEIKYCTYCKFKSQCRKDGKNG